MAMTRELDGSESVIWDADRDECVIYEADEKTFIGGKSRNRDGGFALGFWAIQLRAVIRAIDKHSGNKLRNMAERWKIEGHEKCGDELLAWLDRGRNDKQQNN